MYKSIDVSMFACIIYVCMHVHIYGGKNLYVCVQANVHESICICI